VRGDVASERVERGAVAPTLRAAEHRERQHACVRLEHLGRRVGAGVVVDDELVVTREVLERSPDLPEQHADRRRLVVNGDADVEHVSSA
jgi:hypothetical protein